MAFLTGYRTYVAAAGLLGLGIYQITQGQIEAGLASLGQALGLFGLRKALGG
jgi:hypothetical protein